MKPKLLFLCAGFFLCTTLVGFGHLDHDTPQASPPSFAYKSPEFEMTYGSMEFDTIYIREWEKPHYGVAVVDSVKPDNTHINGLLTERYRVDTAFLFKN